MRGKPTGSSSPSEPTPQDLIRLAIDLDLTALAESLSQLLAEAERLGQSYTDFALAMLRHEWGRRHERKLTRGLKRSHLGTVEDLQGFDFSLRPQLEPRVVRELMNCRFIDEKRNVLCVGKPGLGKTRIAKTIAHAACLKGYSVLFTNTAEMLEDLDSSTIDGSFARTFRRYTKPALVVADEFGYEAFDSKHARYLFRIVSARHRQGSIITTANTFRDWSRLFPSEGQAAATMDRLLDRATVLRFSGKTSRDPRDIHGAPLDE